MRKVLNADTIHIKNDLLKLIDIKENKVCWFQYLHIPITLQDAKF